MQRFSVEVSLPPTWEQVPEQQHAYRRAGVSGGVLRLSLKAPLEPPPLDAATVSAHLTALLSKSSMDVGDEIKAFTSTLEMGPAASSLRKSEKRGLLQFWLIAGEITVFASYTMGNLAEATTDLAGAQQIIAGLALVEES
jgi:hypothetical protein